MWCAPSSVNRPRKQHEVEAVGPVPLSFVKSRSLLHQVLQVSGIHLQPSDHVIHVALIVLVMNFTKGQGKGRRMEGKEKSINCKYLTNRPSVGSTWLHTVTSLMATAAHESKNSQYLMIFPRQFSTFLKSGLFSGSSSQQFLINMYTLETGHIKPVRDISDNAYTMAGRVATQTALTHL